MRITRLEIRRNRYTFTTEILGRATEPGAVVGQVEIADEHGGCITAALTAAQIDAALAAIANSAADQAHALAAAVSPGAFTVRPVLEHLDAAPAPPALDPDPVDGTDLADPALVFEAGQSYWTRDCQLVTIDGIEPANPDFPLRGTEPASGDVHSWTAAGRYISDFCDHRLDLVAPGDLAAPELDLAAEPAPAIEDPDAVF